MSVWLWRRQWKVKTEGTKIELWGFSQPIRVEQSDHKLLIGHVGEQRSEAAEHKWGGTVCINKSKEWNDLAPSPSRTTSPAPLMSVRNVPLPKSELLCSHGQPLDRRCCNVVPSSCLVILEGVRNCAEQPCWSFALILSCRNAKRRWKRGRDKTAHHVWVASAWLLPRGALPLVDTLALCHDRFASPVLISCRPFRYEPLIQNLILHLNLLRCLCLSSRYLVNQTSLVSK